MSVYSYGPQGPDGQEYHSQEYRRAVSPAYAPGGPGGPVIDMVPAKRKKQHPFLYGLVLVALCGAAAYFGTVYANSRTQPEPQNVVVYQAPSGGAPVTEGARLDAASVAAAALLALTIVKMTRNPAELMYSTPPRSTTTLATGRAVKISVGPVCGQRPGASCAKKAKSKG